MNPAAILGKIRQYPIAIGGLICALIIGGLAYVRNGALSEKRSTVEELKGTVAKIDTNIQEGIGLPEDLEAAQELKERILNHLVDPEDDLTIKRYFYSLEDKTGAIIGNIVLSSYEPGKKGAAFSKVTYILSVGGTFQQTLDLLLQITSGKYLGKISLLDLSFRPGDLAGGSQMKLSIEILGEK